MKTLNVHGIVFDLDATLINLGGFVDWTRAHEEIVESYLVMDCQDETVQACSAKGLFSMLDEMYVNMVGERGEEEAKNAQDTVYAILSSYEEQGVNSCTLMDGCLSTLDWVKKRGVSMGICTSNSGKSAMEALRIQGLNDYFDVVVGRTVKFPMKPHPAQLVECFRLLKVAPNKGVMVGDSHKDVIAGKKAGAYTIGVPAHFTRLDLMKDAGADVIIENLSKLPRVLESL